MLDRWVWNQFIREWWNNIDGTAIADTSISHSAILSPLAQPQA